MSPKSKYTGILKEPIVLPSPLLSMGKQGDEIVLNAEIEKLFALQKHFGITPGPHSFTMLALALAREYVPGFSVVEGDSKKPKRPNEYTGTGEKGLRLWALVQSHKKEAGYPEETEAVRAVIVHEPEFKGKLYKTVWRRYMEVKEKNVLLKILKKAALTVGCPEDALDDTLAEEILKVYLPDLPKTK